MLAKMFYPTAGVGWYHPFVLFIILSFALIHLVKVSRLEDYLELSPTAWHTPVGCAWCLARRNLHHSYTHNSEEQVTVHRLVIVSMMIQ